MKYLELDKITDPFIRQLINEFGVTGFTFKNKGEDYLVGQPTQKKHETKKDKRIRWKLFYKRGGK